MGRTPVAGRVLLEIAVVLMLGGAREPYSERCVTWE
jgi:hypothetical protein